MATSDASDGRLRMRVQQEEVIAELGLRALKSADIDELGQAAVTDVRETLGVAYCSLFEMRTEDADTDVILRADAGRDHGAIGSTGIEPPTPMEQTLVAGEPVIAHATDERESAVAPTLADEDVASSLTVPILAESETGDDRWGVLGVYTTTHRDFSDQTVAFVTRVADVLGSAIENARAERRHRRDVALASHLVETNLDGVLGVDSEWTITDANERAATLLDTVTDPTGQSFWDLLAMDADSQFERTVRTAMAQGDASSFESYVPSLETWFDVHVSPTETGLAVYLRDVTERKAVAGELREANRTLQRLYAITADRDRSFDEKVEAVLTLGCERLGLESGFLAEVGVDDDRFEIVYATTEDEQLQAGSTTALSETYCQQTITAEGLLGFIDEPTEAIGDEAYERWGLDCYLGGEVVVEGEPYGTLCFASDAPRHSPFTPAEKSFVELTTQWVSYELERQRNRERLERLVDDLEESNERLEQFAYAASHDLQEPLRMVSSYLRLVDQRYADDLDDDAQEFIEFAVNGADRMQEMIDGLLAYSRVDTQGKPFEPVDLETVFEDVTADLEMRIDETDAEITVEELPTVYGDPGQLRQLFQNLLDNALTYSGQEAPRISVFAEKEGTKWVVSVRDQGIGIDPDDTGRIFRVFDRLHSVDEYDGTGIGLALCQRIVERHDGDIRVDSRPGDGATFSVPLSALAATERTNE